MNLTKELTSNPNAFLYATCNVTSNVAGRVFSAESYGLLTTPDLSQDCRAHNYCPNAFNSSLIPRTTGHSSCNFTGTLISCPHPDNSSLPLTSCRNITNLFGMTDVRCEYRRNDTRRVQGVVYLSQDTINALTPENKSKMIRDDHTEGLYAIEENEAPYRTNFTGLWELKAWNTRPSGSFKLDLAELNQTLADMGKNSSAVFNLTSYCYAAMFDSNREGEPKLFRNNFTIAFNANTSTTTPPSQSPALRPDLFAVNRIPVFVDWSANNLYFIVQFNSQNYPNENWSLKVEILDHSKANASIATYSSTNQYLDHMFFSSAELVKILNITSLADQPTSYFYRISALDSSGAPKFYFDTPFIYLIPPAAQYANVHTPTDCSVQSYTLSLPDGSTLAPTDASNPSHYFVPSTHSFVYVNPKLGDSCTGAPPTPSNSLVSIFEELKTECQLNNTCASSNSFCQEI